ncbi:hypothetical protein LRR81_13560 [Metabacillus sp. GX 13764]|uniref:hypothetical protein n=1 Tax=Metabacillus kandeliae TaxID=2900151 RepID=UPI001E62BDE7|nr:hypothetical protein [Metabacillus kandeliae]MCD7035269.1 hypothetical protein [Metabacillus kandeliae]
MKREWIIYFIGLAIFIIGINTRANDQSINIFGIIGLSIMAIAAIIDMTKKYKKRRMAKK